MGLPAALVIGTAVILSMVSGRAIPDSLVPSVHLHGREDVHTDGDKEFYCGWGYTEKGLRGQQVLLTPYGVRDNHRPTMNSALVAQGCACEWMSDKGCRREQGYYLETREFMGDFDAPIQCYSCVLVARDAEHEDTTKKTLSGRDSLIVADPTPSTSNLIKREGPSTSNVQIDYCGWGYSDVGLRGEIVPLLRDHGDYNMYFHLKSAIVSDGCGCDFKGDRGCSHRDGYFLRTHNAFQGDFAEAIGCFECYPEGEHKRSEARLIAEQSFDFTADSIERDERSSDETDAVAVGWAYSKKGLRGARFKITCGGKHNLVVGGGFTLASASIGQGYGITFTSDGHCHKDRGYFIRTTNGFLGDFPHPIGCVHCDGIGETSDTNAAEDTIM